MRVSREDLSSSKLVHCSAFFFIQRSKTRQRSVGFRRTHQTSRLWYVQGRNIRRKEGDHILWNTGLHCTRGLLGICLFVCLFVVCHYGLEGAMCTSWFVHLEKFSLQILHWQLRHPRSFLFYILPILVLSNLPINILLFPSH